MSKIALITDQHFGGKQDSQYFSDYIEKFYTNQFFPYLAENNITTVIDLGDTFDRRKYVNFNTLQQVKKFYFDVLLIFSSVSDKILFSLSVCEKFECFSKSESIKNSD